MKMESSSAPYIKICKDVRKYAEMYAEDLITKEELKENVDGLLEQQRQIEQQLKMISFDSKWGEDIPQIMERTLQTVNYSLRDIANTRLKQIIDYIEVDREGNVDINFRLLKEVNEWEREQAGVAGSI